MPAALHGGSHTRSASTEKLFMRTPVPAADVILLPMEIIIGGTALTPAILQIASEGSVAVMNDTAPGKANAVDGDFNPEGLRHD